MYADARLTRTRVVSLPRAMAVSKRVCSLRHARFWKLLGRKDGYRNPAEHNCAFIILGTETAACSRPAASTIKKPIIASKPSFRKRDV